MKKAFAMLGAAVLLSPVAATAATYNYVDTMGNVDSVEANSPMAAMAIAGDIHPRSGVALDDGDLDSGTAIGGSGDASVSGGTPGTYHYVTVNGEVNTVSASSASQVMMMSDIHPHSGVAVDQGILQDGTDVPGT